ncbi:acyltransferase [Agromyces intestinalis]|uniref:Acyltransferase n=1 Tax=Agromyces intestinalis TaxID=2592652 RepID=A0A5C1YGF7_9MICO|nr:acyltransferase family protein [Agromyces intestinalis]QEO14169.1 acyltransferase [Agromyces intestinalis]
MSVLIRTDVARKDWMELVKGVAIILVVIFHTMLFLRALDYQGGGLGRSKIAFEPFPMPAFFVITGMFALRVPQWTFAEVWKRRLAQYLYLYVLWSVIRFAFYLVVPNVRAEDGAGVTASDPLALALIFVWPTSSYWFIYALLLFTIAVWLVRKAPIWAQLAGAGVVSVLFSSGLADTHNVGWNRMGEYLVFFVAGVVLSKRIDRAVAESKPWHVWASLAVSLAVSALLALVPVSREVPGVALVAQVASLAFGFTAAVRLVRLRPLGFLSYLGKRTLDIYLLHVFVIAGLVAVIAMFPQLHDLGDDGWLVMLVTTTLTIVISILLFRLLSRFTWLFVSPFRVRPGRSRRGSRRAEPEPKALTDATESA